MTEEKLHEAIVDFCNAVEAACVNLKRYIGELHGVTFTSESKAETRNFDNLVWQKVEGSREPYFQATKEGNKNSNLFQALQAVLQKHDGFCHIGKFKYWNHNQNRDIIDRREK